MDSTTVPPVNNNDSKLTHPLHWACVFPSQVFYHPSLLRLYPFSEWQANKPATTTTMLSWRSRTPNPRPQPSLLHSTPTQPFLFLPPAALLPLPGNKTSFQPCLVWRRKGDDGRLVCCVYGLPFVLVAGCVVVVGTFYGGYNLPCLSVMECLDCLSCFGWVYLYCHRSPRASRWVAFCCTSN